MVNQATDLPHQANAKSEDHVKRICCIGAGYVGGPTSAVIAKMCPHIEGNLFISSYLKLIFIKSSKYFN